MIMMIKTIVFLEGPRVRSMTGEIINRDNNGFLVLKTMKKMYEFNNRYIIKIEDVVENGKRNEDDRTS